MKFKKRMEIMISIMISFKCRLMLCSEFVVFVIIVWWVLLCWLDIIIYFLIKSKKLMKLYWFEYGLNWIIGLNFIMLWYVDYDFYGWYL